MVDSKKKALAELAMMMNWDSKVSDTTESFTPLDCKFCFGIIADGSFNCVVYLSMIRRHMNACGYLYLSTLTAATASQISTITSRKRQILRPREPALCV